MDDSQRGGRRQMDLVKFNQLSHVMPQHAGERSSV